jgi:hypothetical protein
MTHYHLAQFNVARFILPADDPQNADFMANLALVNARAEYAPGFVWRLKDESGAGATSIRVSDDPLLVINFSVWESVEALFEFTYKNGEHLAMFRRRNEWFSHHDAPSMVMWWVPAGTIPTVDEALRRLAHLRVYGASADAFTFKQRFPMPDESTAAPSVSA